MNFFIISALFKFCQKKLTTSHEITSRLPLFPNRFLLCSSYKIVNAGYPLFQESQSARSEIHFSVPLHPHFHL